MEKLSQKHFKTIKQFLKALNSENIDYILGEKQITKYVKIYKPFKMKGFSKNISHGKKITVVVPTITITKLTKTWTLKSISNTNVPTNKNLIAIFERIKKEMA